MKRKESSECKKSENLKYNKKKKESKSSRISSISSDKSNSEFDLIYNFY